MTQEEGPDLHSGPPVVRWDQIATPLGTVMVRVVLRVGLRCCGRLRVRISRKTMPEHSKVPEVLWCRGTTHHSRRSFVELQRSLPLRRRKAGRVHTMGRRKSRILWE